MEYIVTDEDKERIKKMFSKEDNEAFHKKMDAFLAGFNRQEVPAPASPTGGNGKPWVLNLI